MRKKIYFLVCFRHIPFVYNRHILVGYTPPHTSEKYWTSESVGESAGVWFATNEATASSFVELEFPWLYGANRQRDITPCSLDRPWGLCSEKLLYIASCAVTTSAQPGIVCILNILLNAFPGQLQSEMWNSLILKSYVSYMLNMHVNVIFKELALR